MFEKSEQTFYLIFWANTSGFNTIQYSYHEAYFNEASITLGSDLKLLLPTPCLRYVQGDLPLANLELPPPTPPPQPPRTIFE
jgi:hypothetical protein